MKRTLLNLVAGICLSACGDTVINQYYGRPDGSLPMEQDAAAPEAEDLGTSNAGDAALPEPPTQSCVTLEWFLDYEGPFDKRFFDETYPLILRDYGEEVHFLYKNFPLEKFHFNARDAARSAECARLQDALLAYQAVLFGTQDIWRAMPMNTDLFGTYATQLGLDSGEFDQCRTGQEVDSLIDADIQEAMTRGAQGVPTFFINETQITGAQPYPVFSDAIEAELVTCAQGMK